MDVTAMSAIVDAITKSGNAFLFVAVYVAWRASQSAKQAVEHIKELRDIAVKAAPAVEAMAERVEDIHRTWPAIDARTSTMDLKLSALVARKP